MLIYFWKRAVYHQSSCKKCSIINDIPRTFSDIVHNEVQFSSHQDLYVESQTKILRRIH